MRYWFVVLTLGMSLLCCGSILRRVGDAIPYCRSIVLGDLDGDGDLDALTEKQTAAQVWLNDGTGYFLDSGQRIRHSDRFVVNVGDVDGDGDTDVFATHYDKGYRVWCNDGSGQFRQSRRTKPFPWLVGGCAVATIVGLSLWWAPAQTRLSVGNDNWDNLGIPVPINDMIGDRGWMNADDAMIE